MPQSKHTIASIRFGYGLNGTDAGASSARALIASLAQDTPEARVTTKARFGHMRRLRKLRGDNSAQGQKAFKAARQYMRKLVHRDFHRALGRAVESETGFGTRLTQFWADHFTIVGRNPVFGMLAGALVEEAVRPHLSGRFGDMLVAASTHPAMLMYLDQNKSFGNNSVAAKKRRKGLNENLAREILELHSLGVGAGYVQRDVHELAELLTGLTVGKSGREFRQRLAEPGAETVLGTTYASHASLQNIEEALQNIALHPATAKHLSSKLVRHFVSDQPDREQVAFMAERYLQTEGDLRATYAAMLEHPASWADIGGKVKQPFDYVASTLRAVRFDLDAKQKQNRNVLRRQLPKALLTMGQPYLRPGGPNGWPEEAEFWITPAGVAARIDWASSLASGFGRDLDPRSFLKTTLADATTPKLRALAAGAEVKWEGVALVLASPDFNRR